MTSAAPKIPCAMSLHGFPGVRDDNGVIFRDHNHGSLREFTAGKVVASGLNRIMLCDWHSPLPASATFHQFPSLNTSKLGFGDWTRVVAVKHIRHLTQPMDTLQELQVLKNLPSHPNIVSLLDYFSVTPEDHESDTGKYELYLVLEAMEGNLYHLIRSRRNAIGIRPFAAGLVSSIFHQIVCGLQHIHANDYFHRDIKPENILVTTTSLANYLAQDPYGRREAGSNDTAPEMQRDIVAILKLTDFGLARKSSSTPPYTEYLSTRWYRSPEQILIKSTYTLAVDMWAVGTVMAEVVNLTPLFPGINLLDQMMKIVDTMGTPGGKPEDNLEDDEPESELTIYAQLYDERGFAKGGGLWREGWQLAAGLGYVFPESIARPFFTHFRTSTHPLLVDCIHSLLKYDPAMRLTAQQCLDHGYFRATSTIRVPRSLPLETA